LVRKGVFTTASKIIISTELIQDDQPKHVLIKNRGGDRDRGHVMWGRGWRDMVTSQGTSEPLRG
jgi:hypothetical protein